MICRIRIEWVKVIFDVVDELHPFVDMEGYVDVRLKDEDFLMDLQLNSFLSAQDNPMMMNWNRIHRLMFVLH